MPGVPKKVGNSGENVCVRSVTLLNAGNGRASATAGATVDRAIVALRVRGVSVHGSMLLEPRVPRAAHGRPDYPP